jgi:hypothetical protein
MRIQPRVSSSAQGAGVEIAEYERRREASARRALGLGRARSRWYVQALTVLVVAIVVGFLVVPTSRTEPKADPVEWSIIKSR